jgi:hypothetical protein
MYNQLPSTILREGSSFDIMVADIYTAWERHKSDPSDASQYKENDLAELLKTVKGD